MPQSATAQRPVSDQLRDIMEKLTPSERRAARVLMSHYPMAGLESITVFARRAGVSGATILRLLGKLGFSGYPEFQSVLRSELTTRLSSPLGRWEVQQQEDAPEKDFLSRFGAQVSENIEQTIDSLSRSEFNAIVELLCQPKRPLYVLGGRFTSALAHYLFLHLRAVRANVHEVGGQSAAWPDQLLDLGRNDVLAAFDVRRYQPDIAAFVNEAARRRTRIILFTDEWMSPAVAQADHVIAVRTVSPFGWDSSAALMMTVEALIAAVMDRLGDSFADRLKDLEAVRTAWALPVPDTDK